MRTFFADYSQYLLSTKHLTARNVMTAFLIFSGDNAFCNGKRKIIVSTRHSAEASILSMWHLYNLNLIAWIVFWICSTCAYWYAVGLTTKKRPLISAIDHYHSQEVCYNVVFLCYTWWETCLHSRVLYSSLPSAAHSDSKALYRFLSADEIKTTAVCVWCAFQQRDLPASSRYGLRGEFLWGGLNSSLSSFPPPLPSILAEHKQLAGLCSSYTTCLPQCSSQVTISQGQRLRGIVEHRFLCVPVASIVHRGTGESAHSIAGRGWETERVNWLCREGVFEESKTCACFIKIC